MPKSRVGKPNPYLFCLFDITTGRQAKVHAIVYNVYL